MHFRRALALNPNDAAAMNNIGIALERQGNKRAAIHYFAEASKLDPTSSLSRSNATRAARVGAGGVVAAVVASRLVIHFTSDSDSGSGSGSGQDRPGPGTGQVPIVVGPDGAGVPIVQPPTPSPTESGPPPSLWLVGSVLLLVALLVGVATTVRRRLKEKTSGHPVASRELIRQIRREDRGHGVEVRWSWLRTRSLLALGLLVTLSVAWAGFASISRDGLSGWAFGLGGLAASVGLVGFFTPRLRRTR